MNIHTFLIGYGLLASLFCTDARAQISVDSVNASVHARVDEQQTTASERDDSSRKPVSLSSWSSRPAKQGRATTSWSGMASTSSPSTSSSSASDPPSETVWHPKTMHFLPDDAKATGQNVRVGRDGNRYDVAPIAGAGTPEMPGPSSPFYLEPLKAGLFYFSPDGNLSPVDNRATVTRPKPLRRARVDHAPRNIDSFDSLADKKH
jgi:hypothetical protein